MLKTTLGQVALVGGKRDDQPRGVLVDERVSHFAKGRDRGSLYILVQVSGQGVGRDDAADQLAQVIHEVYYNWRGSITAGLQEALRQANHLLFEENRNSLPGERRTAGVSCAVLRDADLFVVQIGPAAVYLAQGGHVRRFPDVSPWLDDGVTPEEMEAVALGERREPHLSLFHSPVNMGDVVLLAEGGLAERVSSQRWPDILSAGSVDRVLEALLAAGRGGDLVALVVALREGIDAALAQPLPPDKAQARSEPLLHSALGQISTWLARFRPGERLKSTGRALATALAGFWGVLLTFLKRMVPGQLPTSEAQPTATKRSVETPPFATRRTEAGLPDAVKRTETRPPAAVKRTEERSPVTVKRTEERPGRRKVETTTPAESDIVQKVLIVAAIVIPLIVAAVVVLTLVQRGQASKTELETLLQQANQKWTEAGATTDQPTILARLTEVDALLDQLLQLDPDYVETTDLRKKVEARLDEINQVKRATWIAELNAYPADAALSRVVVEGAHVFVLDRHAGRVYHHKLDDQRQTLQPDTKTTLLVSKGDQVGDLLVGDLVDMVWMPMGDNRSKADLLILESSGGLLEFDPATEELHALDVAASDTWQFPKLVGAYYGRFYILDSGANKIWRYYPTADGYSNPPDDWLQEAIDLAGVVDMAIGDNIYLLFADGAVRKLAAGRPAPLDISDWDTPPLNPAAIFTRPPEDAKWIYVADRGNSRIVQCSVEGQFKRQFRLVDSWVGENGDALAQATSLFVDEISAHAYFLSGQKLYLLILPD